MPLHTAHVRLLPDLSVPIAQTIVGHAEFKQHHSNVPIHISLSITGLSPRTTHGWHIHKTPLSEGPVNCTKAGPHFNPRNATHGSPKNDATKRHVGDLGNFKTDASGSVKLRVTDKLVTLYGSESVNNLALAVHEKIDDLGLGGANVSLTTGNTGLRLACGNIIIQRQSNVKEGVSTMLEGYSTVTESSAAASATDSILSSAIQSDLATLFVVYATLLFF